MSRLSHLAIVGSNVVNGVSKLHTRLLKDKVFNDFEDILPGKIINATNGVTPRRWVNKWGEWRVRPEDEDIELDLIQEVVQQTKAIARAHGQPVDLEWVYNGHGIHWVQLREITALDISSSDIRARLREARSVRYLLPDPVREAIERSGVYRRGS